MVPGWIEVANGGIVTTMNLSLYRWRTIPELQTIPDDEVCTGKIGHGWNPAESDGETGAWVTRNRKSLQVRAYSTIDRVTGSKAQRGRTSNLPSRLGRWATGSGFRNLEPTFAL